MPKKKKSKKLKKTKVSKKGNKKAVKVLKLVSKSPEKKTSITGNDEKPEIKKIVKVDLCFSFNKLTRLYLLHI